MSRFLFRSSRPIVFGHRGAGGVAPENTLAAFDQGLALGADGLELDVHLARDGVVVVHHDRTLDRTTNLHGPIAAWTAGDLSRADAGHFFPRGAGFPFRGCGIGVPTLAEVLARYPDVLMIVELKVDSVELARATIDVVRAARAVDRVCLGSFGLGALRAARAIEPAITTSAAGEEVRRALYRSWCGWPASRVPYGGYQVPEWAGRTRVLSPHFIHLAHRAGLGVQAWTIDTEQDGRRLLDWGIDGLITDRPDLIVPLARGRA